MHYDGCLVLQTHVSTFQQAIVQMCVVVLQHQKLALLWGLSQMRSLHSKFLGDSRDHRHAFDVEMQRMNLRHARLSQTVELCVFLD